MAPNEAFRAGDSEIDRVVDEAEFIETADQMELLGPADVVIEVDEADVPSGSSEVPLLSEVLEREFDDMLDCAFDESRLDTIKPEGEDGLVSSADDRPFTAATNADQTGSEFFIPLPPKLPRETQRKALPAEVHDLPETEVSESGVRAKRLPLGPGIPEAWRPTEKVTLPPSVDVGDDYPRNHCYAVARERLLQGLEALEILGDEPNLTPERKRKIASARIALKLVLEDPTMKK